MSERTHLVRLFFAPFGSDGNPIVIQMVVDHPTNSLEVAFQGSFLLPELRRASNRLLAAKGHVDDSIQLIDEKHGIHAHRNGGHLASCYGPHEVRAFFAIDRAKNRPIMPGYQRLGELTYEHRVAADHRPHPGGAQGVHTPDARVVGPVPHELDRLAHLLRDLRGLQRAVEEELAAEGAAALDDVEGDRADRQAEDLGDLALRCGQAFGLGLYGMDLVETPSGPQVVDVNYFPGYKGVPDVAPRIAAYVERYARGRAALEPPTPPTSSSHRGRSSRPGRTHV